MTKNNWLMLCHLAALAMFLIPFGNIVGPLIVWLLKKEEIAEVDSHGKEAVNFQITVTIFMLIAAALSFILIGIPLMILIAIANLVFIIKASVDASKGETYTYPFNLRLIK